MRSSAVDWLRAAAAASSISPEPAGKLLVHVSVASGGPDHSAPACWPAWPWRRPAPLPGRAECRADRSVGRLLSEGGSFETTSCGSRSADSATLLRLRQQLLVTAPAASGTVAPRAATASAPRRLSSSSSSFASRRILGADLLHFAHHVGFGRLVRRGATLSAHSLGGSSRSVEALIGPLVCAAA